MEQITLRPYQSDAVKAMLAHDSGICVAPAGSGKTIIAASIVTACHSKLTESDVRNPPIVWVAHTKEQVEQARSALAAVCPHVDVHTCCYAANPDTSLAAVLIVDECHHAGAQSVSKLVDDAGWSRYVYGFTATPQRQDGVDISEIIGPVLYEVRRDEVQQAGGVVPAVVRVVEFGTKDCLAECVQDEAERKYTGNLRWCDDNDGTTTQWDRCLYRAALNIGIRDNKERNELIAWIAGRHASDSKIVLVDSKAHGTALEKVIPGAVFVSASTRGRAKKIDAFKAGEITTMIATQLADEGLDCPIASVLILAAGGKAKGKVIQRTGRVLRPYEDKAYGIIYEIKDNTHGMLTAQHWQRMRVYKSQGYRITGAYA